MGTDIHLIAEVKQNDGTWRKLGRRFKYPYYNPNSPTKIYPETEYDDGEVEESYISNPEFTDEPYHARNYRLFAALSGVRNGYGFAGVPTGGAVEPIAEDRGLPDDVSEESRKWIESHSDHSEGWALLSEIEAYDWDQPFYQTGVMSAADYRVLRDTGTAPESWSGSITGPGITTYTAEQFDLLEKTSSLPKIQASGTGWSARSNIYVVIDWPQEGGLRACIGPAFFDVVEELSKQYGSDRVRFIFGYDS